MVSLEVFWIASDAVHLVEYKLIHVYALLHSGLRAHDFLHRQPRPALLPGCSLLELLHGIALPIVRDIDPWAGRTEAKEPRHQRRAKQHRRQRHPMPAQLCADRSRRGLCRRGWFRLRRRPCLWRGGQRRRLQLACLRLRPEADPQLLRQLQQHLRIRHGAAHLPMGDGLPGHVHRPGQRLLGHARPLSRLVDLFADVRHAACILCIGFLASIIAQPVRMTIPVQSAHIFRRGWAHWY